MSTSPDLFRLPTDILLLVAAYLRHHEALSFALVNKALAGLILDFLYRFNIGHENSSLLHWAVTHGKDALVRKLLEDYHPDVNAVHKGQTPLIAASCSPHRSIFSRLVRRRDVQADFATAVGRTALLYAASFGHTHYIEPLLVRNVQVNAPDRLGYTPLAIAVKKGCRDVVSCLLRVPGIDINATTRHGLSPLALAVKYRRVDIATRLLRYPQIDVHRGHPSNTPLALAIKLKPNPVLELLVTHSKFDINIDVRRQSAFLEALEQNNQEAAWLLLQKECRIDVPNDGDLTALDLAIEYRMEPIVREIISRSPRLKFAYDRMWPPLCRAVHVRSAEIAQLLIASGANVNEKDREGESPLHHAAYRRDRRIVELLLSGPAIDVNTVNRWGLTPLHVAATNGLLWMVKMLLSAPRINPNAKDHNGMTPLFVALSDGHGPIVEQLLEDGRVDANIRTNCGLTSIHYAAANGSIQILNQLLLVTNLDPNTRDRYGKSPLDWARRHRSCMDRLRAWENRTVASMAG